MKQNEIDTNYQKDCILDVAIQQFCEKGYTKTRMDDIAEVIGITKTPIYYNFNNKAELFDAAYRKVMNELYYKNIAIFTKNCSIYDKLYEAVVIGLVSHNCQIGEMNQIIIKEKHELSKTLQYLKEIREIICKSTTSAMISAQKSGEIKTNVDVDEFYSVIYACYIGVLSYVTDLARLKDLSYDDMEQLSKKLIDKIFIALKPLYFNEGYY